MKIKHYSVFFLLIVLACHAEKKAELNQSASMTNRDQLPEDPLIQKVICSSINTRKNTMSTLYGNDTAFQYAFDHNGGNYPEGSVLYQITWLQKDDPRWFGGKIPGTIRSVEIVRFERNEEHKVMPVYQLYQGLPLKGVNVTETNYPIKSITSQRMSVIP